MIQGWISVHRKFMGHWLYVAKPYDTCHAWLDILLSVNHEDRKVLFDGKLLPVKAGQMITSLSKLSERWGWGSRMKIKRFLELLQSDGMVDLERYNYGTLLTVANWELYQCHDTQMLQARYTGVTETNTNNKDNNVNNENKGNKKGRTSARFEPPSVDEVKAYCEERNNGIDPEAFIAFYASKGWKVGNQQMKDWKQSVITWEKRRKVPQKNEEPYNVFLAMARDEGIIK